MSLFESFGRYQGGSVAPASILLLSYEPPDQTRVKHSSSNVCPLTASRNPANPSPRMCRRVEKTEDFRISFLLRAGSSATLGP